MAEKNQSFLARLGQRFSKRERVLTAITLTAVLSALLYQFPYVAGERSIQSLGANITETEKDILDLTARIADVKARAAEIKAGGASVVPGRELITEKGVVLLLEDVSAEARRLGVNLVAVHPSQEIDKEKYKEIAMNMDLKARYREIGEYFKRLESLARVVNIRKLRMEACPDASSVCAVQVEAVTYMAK